MMISRGCPYPCTFCSVAPVWNLESSSRSAENIVAEMVELHGRAGVGMFLFQDEFFVSGKRQEEYFRLIQDHPDIFPGFFHVNLAGNVLPKLELLTQFGFYTMPDPSGAAEAESCGAHSPRIAAQV